MQELADEGQRYERLDDDAAAYPNTVRTIIGPTIALRSGAYFDFLAPESSGFTIDDIAHGLSNVCRFAGQTRKFYSVAEHSVHVSRIIGLRFAYAGLMHDAPEAFIGDIPKPLKNLLPDYANIEHRTEVAVLSRFDVPFPLPPAVKLTDLAMLRAEQSQAMENEDFWGATEGAPAADVTLEFWSPDRAKFEFLRRFRELTPCGAAWRRP